MASTRKGVINVRFNQDQGCFVACMESGLRIYNTDPLQQKTHYEVDLIGSVSQCEMIYRTNVFAVVSGGPRPKYPDNMVLIFDDLCKRVKLELTFTSTVLAVRLRKDRIVVAQLSQVHVFGWPSPACRLFSLDTRENPRGLLDLSPLMSAEKQIIVFPGHKIGSVQMVDLTSTEVGTSTAPVWIQAHRNELGCLALNQQGTRLATASVKGTLIRVWDTTTKTQLVELRRGSDPATIYCINFSRDSEYLCCSSDKGTVHIFAIKNTNLNRRSALPHLGLLGNYGESQWALANFTVQPELACICAFGSNSSVIAICLDGTYHKYVFNADGNCNREAYDVFLNVCDDDDDDFF